MMWKIQQAMQNDAIRTTRIYPAVHSGNRDEVFIWQNFQPAYRDLGWKNRDLGNRASPPSHMNTSKILQQRQLCNWGGGEGNRFQKPVLNLLLVGVNWNAVPI